MSKERTKFLRSIDPHGLEQDVNYFVESETRSIIDIVFINTVTGHGNEIYYDAYVRYTPKSHSRTSTKEVSSE
ncbi:MAG: hypothetical protein M3530_10645 [Thermoproteota archaeon]|jgi:hypothetical protein|nr:hypothetical protein [Thermoproteota archaeon]